jgi:hypothetical protein
MDHKYVVYVHTNPNHEPTELFVWAEDKDDAIGTVGYMIEKLGGDIKRAHKVTAEIDD